MNAENERVAAFVKIKLEDWEDPADLRYLLDQISTRQHKRLEEKNLEI